ncbi:MAG: hypothetical protein Q7T17_12695 [Microbacterium sp.]|uniref:hypothetical protein n=1 Tax=Microbacterium sp. TaxID=51671 RepID=UPI002723D862|nr:hypothetical protein [Microbacterium sp.]MDO8383820.1 hypothetical protein [Microbacterium sp.]
MGSEGFAHVRFIGYAIPTAPAMIVPLGNPDRGSAMGGTNLGLGDVAADVGGRLSVMRAAVHAARDALPTGETDVLNVFVAPEFFWHGPQGPYLHASGAPDPVAHILERLAAEFPAEEYPNWVFVFGTAVTAAADDPHEVFSRPTTRVRNGVVADLAHRYRQAAADDAAKVFDMIDDYLQWGHAHPVVQVRNRALIVSATPLGSAGARFTAHAATTDKVFDSAEDLVLWDVTGREDVVTEQMSAHPYVDLSAGDLKRDPFDAHAILRLGATDGSAPDIATDIAVEICLDHADARLRGAMSRTRWPRGEGGIDLQIVPSCGAALSSGAVAAVAGGYAFNVDGQLAVGDSILPTGSGSVFGVRSAYGNYIDPANPRYRAHTQLAGVVSAAVGDDGRSPSASDAELARFADDLVTVVPVVAPPTLDTFFSGGPGAVHIYGLRAPLPLGPARQDASAPI